MSVVRSRPPGLGRGIIGSIRRYWSSLSAWPAPKSPTNTRSAGLHILVSRKDRSSSPTATSGGGAHFTRSQPPFQNGLSGGGGITSLANVFITKSIISNNGLSNGGYNCYGSGGLEIGGGIITDSSIIGNGNGC